MVMGENIGGIARSRTRVAKIDMILREVRRKVGWLRRRNE